MFCIPRQIDADLNNWSFLMFAFAQESRQEHSPLAAFPLSGLLAPLRFVDTGVASQLEEKPGAKTWPGEGEK